MTQSGTLEAFGDQSYSIVNGEVSGAAVWQNKVEPLHLFHATHNVKIF